MNVLDIFIWQMLERIYNERFCSIIIKLSHSTLILNLKLEIKNFFKKLWN